MKLTFRYSIHQCDIHEPNTLADYRRLLTRWNDWLDGDDVNAIWSQLHSLAWTDATHRIVKASQKLSRPHGDLWASRNPLLVEYCDNAWIAFMVMGIGKLTDRSSDVISLSRLIDDMTKNASSLTRENYVCRDGLRYDPLEAEQLHRKLVVEPNLAAGNRIWSSEHGGPDDANSSTRHHESFDRVGEAEGSSRERVEVLRPDLLPGLQQRLCQARKTVQAIRNKFIAHAADEESRRSIADHRITFGNIEQSFKTVVEVAYIVTSHVLPLGQGQLLPHPQFNQLQGLDRPWLPDRGMRKLERIWDGYRKRTDAWRPRSHD